MKTARQEWTPPASAVQVLRDAAALLTTRDELAAMPATLQSERFILEGTLARLQRDHAESRQAIAIWLNRNSPDAVERLSVQCTELETAIGVTADKIAMYELRIDAAKTELAEFDRDLAARQREIDEAWLDVSGSAKDFCADALHAGMAGTDSLLRALRLWHATETALGAQQRPVPVEPVYEVPSLFGGSVTPLARPGRAAENLILGPRGRILSGTVYYPNGGSQQDLGDWQDDPALVKIHREISELRGLHRSFERAIVAAAADRRRIEEAEQAAASPPPRTMQDALRDGAERGVLSRGEAGPPRYVPLPQREVPSPAAETAHRFIPAKYVSLPQKALGEAERPWNRSLAGGRLIQSDN